MLRILLAVTALLIYGSLYPWHFHARPDAGGPLQALLGSWRFTFNRFALRDIAINTAIYVPFGASAYLWLNSRPAVVRVAAPILLAAALSTAIEIAQFYDSQRVTSLVDIVTNISGAILGMALATIVARRTRGASAIGIPHPGALVLLACWAGTLLFPFIPDFSRTHIAGKLSNFFSDGFSPVAFYALFTAWLLSARLLTAVSRDLPRGAVFPLLGLLLPTRFLVLGVPTGWTYFASFLTAWTVWSLFLAVSRNSDSILVWMTLVSIVATGLAPLHFSSAPQYFEWVPFRALFSTQWETGFSVFLKKIFLYGSAVWLFHEQGVRWLFAAARVALLLAAIEAAQLYLPNHAAEITDPLLAMLMAWILHRLARARLVARRL